MKRIGNAGATAIGLFAIVALLSASVSLAGRGKSPPSAPDAYQAAITQPERSKADLDRDAIDHPAEVLRAAGIRRGMHVADILAADGYYSEIVSRIVGPTGHVLLLNNAAFEKWSEGAWANRLANGRLPNVEHRQAELENMQLGDDTYDAVLLIKVYHDLYWVQPNSPWPPVDVPKVLDEIRRAVRPGGILLLVDHSARPGTGAQDAGTIHRIDEAYARAEFERLGFKLIGSSDVLRHPEDKRDLITYKGPMLGHTDRFVLIFRKIGGAPVNPGAAAATP